MVKEGTSAIGKIFILFAFASILFGGLGFVTHSLGLWGQTYVERVVTKQSFQYREGMEQQAAIWEATITELETQLATCDSDETCQGIRNQISVVKARLKAATVNKDW